MAARRSACPASARSPRSCTICRLQSTSLAERGVAFIDAPHRIADMGTYELWMTFFWDLDHNPLAFRSEIKK